MKKQELTTKEKNFLIELLETNLEGYESERSDFISYGENYYAEEEYKACKKILKKLNK